MNIWWFQLFAYFRLCALTGAAVLEHNKDGGRGSLVVREEGPEKAPSRPPWRLSARSKAEGGRSNHQLPINTKIGRLRRLRASLQWSPGLCLLLPSPTTEALLRLCSVTALFADTVLQCLLDSRCTPEIIPHRIFTVMLQLTCCIRVNWMNIPFAEVFLRRSIWMPLSSGYFGMRQEFDWWQSDAGKCCSGLLCCSDASQINISCEKGISWLEATEPHKLCEGFWRFRTEWECSFALMLCNWVWRHCEFNNARYPPWRIMLIQIFLSRLLSEHFN